MSMSPADGRAVSQRDALIFARPGTVTIQREPMPPPRDSELLIATECSAISPGTEMLFYRGEVPAGVAIDSTIAALSDTVAYPLKYGYAAVGRVIAAGPDVDDRWLGRLVFAFNPHESHFLARADHLIEIPPDLPSHIAALLPNMETAVNFLMDGRPVIGERVLVIGQGIVGLLTTALLSRFPLEDLVVVDAQEPRRRLSLDLGAHSALAASELMQHDGLDFDLVFEVSGNPLALGEAIRHSGFDGRVVVGSWYGNKHASLDLGSHFHRARTRLISSQVSSLHPRFGGRWDKRRRMAVALKLLSEIAPEQLISHRFRLGDAARAYELIDTRPDLTVQVLLTYD